MSIREPKDRCLSPEEAKRFYDRLGSRHDWQDFYENPAINELVAHAAFDSAHSVCEFGCGTGALAARLLQDHLPADTRYVGLHISSTMASPALNSIAHKHYREGCWTRAPTEEAFAHEIHNGQLLYHHELHVHAAWLRSWCEQAVSRKAVQFPPKTPSGISN